MARFVAGEAGCRLLRRSIRGISQAGLKLTGEHK